MEAREALYSGAGHPPLLLWRNAAGRVGELSENGLLLGFRSNEKYANGQFPVEPGDRILLYTDGVVEAANSADEMFGQDRLKRFIESHRNLPADKFADSLFAELAAWRSSTQDDDLTLLVLDIDR